MCEFEANRAATHLLIAPRDNLVFSNLLMRYEPLSVAELAGVNRGVQRRLSGHVTPHPGRIRHVSNRQVERAIRIRVLGKALVPDTMTGKL